MAAKESLVPVHTFRGFNGDQGELGIVYVEDQIVFAALRYRAGNFYDSGSLRFEPSVAPSLGFEHVVHRGSCVGVTVSIPISSEM